MRMLLCVSALLVTATVSWGQRVSGYIFVALGAQTGQGASGSTLHGGAGGEVRLWKGLGVAGEGGAVAWSRNLRSLLGVGSVNGTYHFPTRNPKLDPFVTAGYSALVDLWWHTNAANVGVGTNYWFARHFGLRTEFRDHFTTQGGRVQYWGFRIGLGFR